ncbi:MAG: carbohydrate ABC transporter substrate-binding protein [Clostridia bacterium]|nr:carbohydrate ABC transporter substrate-binding protein [Clostridia bacterium]
MKKFAKGIAMALTLCVSIGAFAGCAVVSSGNSGISGSDVEEVQKGDYTQYTKLTIDAGSQNKAYNTTESLEFNALTNPYPYNTLERLVEEWNKTNAATYGYYFDIAVSSINNDRETMVPMLNNGTAPEIIYYLPTTIAEDQSKGYFYDLKEVMASPNKYSKEGEAGSVQWKDLWSSEDYNSMFSPDGQLFTVCMEKNPIGILYNKTVLEAAGVTETPETYKEFMEAQDKINAYAQSVDRADPLKDTTYLTPFFSKYPWYDSYIESTLWGSKMDVLDVLKEDGEINAEEYVRGYMRKDADGNRLYDVASPTMQEVYRLIKLSTKYYPTNYQSYYTEQQFVAGNIAMVEVTGGSIRELVDSVGGSFEVGVFPYPIVESQPAGAEANEYYTTVDASRYVRRGLSGYCTGWAITNAAMNKDAQKGNQNCVNACIDILQYLSCFENNDKMVNDRGFAIPLSGKTEYSHFITLAEAYAADVSAENIGKTIAWGSATSASSMGSTYYNATVNLRKELINGTPIADVLASLQKTFMTSANSLVASNKWDITSWK